MEQLLVLLTEIAWPVAILLAWVLGELLHRSVRLPRISVYAIVGFALAPAQTGFLPASQYPMMLLLSNIAFGLILFECGYRINLRWLKANRWMAVTTISDAVLSFVSVYLFLTWLALPSSTALLLAALSMATSPATIIRVINEQHSSGQVTERILHLSALNCVLAVFVFKVIVGVSIFHTSGNVQDAIYSSLVVLASSIVLGLVFGFIVVFLLRLSQRTRQDGTLAFVIAVVSLIVLAHSLKLSPVLAALTCGMFARHQRIIFGSSQKGFGTLGDLLSILLFVFIASTLEWRHVWAGLGVGLGMILVRQIAKSVGIALFAHISGIAWRKGVLIGFASAPMSVFVILILEQTRYLGVDLVDQLAPLAAIALVLEVLGPVMVQGALVWAKEVPESKES